MNNPKAATSDEMLMVRYKRGDSSAFVALTERYCGKIFLYISWYLGSDKRAFELTQSTFLQLVRSAATFRHESRFLTWLLTIARSLCNSEGSNLIEKATSTAASEGKLITTSLNEASRTEGLGAANAQSSEQFALEQLGRAERDVFLLRQVGAVSYDEIALITDQPREKVSTLMRSAYERLLASSKQIPNPKMSL